MHFAVIRYAPRAAGLMEIEHFIRFASRAVGLMEVENLIRSTALAVGLMEVENLIRSTALAVGLKPSARQGEARLRGLWRIMYLKTIFHKGSPAASMSVSCVPFPVVSPVCLDTHAQEQTRGASEQMPVASVAVLACTYPCALLFRRCDRLAIQHGSARLCLAF